MKHANFLLAFAFYQRETSPFSSLFGEEESVWISTFFPFFFLSSLSIQRRGQTRNKHVHTDVCEYIHVYIHEHTQGVESLWGEEGVK